MALDRLTKRMDEIRKAINTDDLAKEAYKVFLKNTPIASGAARRNTTLNGSEIRANYPYAGKLDAGRSRQAPNGMVEPTLKFIGEQMRHNLR